MIVYFNVGRTVFLLLFAYTGPNGMTASWLRLIASISQASISWNLVLSFGSNEKIPGELMGLFYIYDGAITRFKTSLTTRMEFR